MVSVRMEDIPSLEQLFGFKCYILINRKDYEEIFYSILLSGMMVLSACDALDLSPEDYYGSNDFGIRSLR